jgi:C4-dicarboxylate transporter DctM subunit
MSRIAGLPLHSIIAGVFPFYAMRVVALILINGFPWLSLAVL